MKHIANCWDLKQCTIAIREVCPAFVQQRGTECWKITGTKCDGGRVEKATTEEKIKHCRGCKFYQEYASKF